MAVAHVNTQSNQNGTGAATLDVTKPTSLANTNVLIAACVIPLAAGTLTLPSGFTQLIDATDATDDTRLKVGYKYITNAAGEPASYTFDFGGTSRKACGVISAYSGVSSNPITGSDWHSVGGTSHYYRNVTIDNTPAFFVGVDAISNSGSFTTAATAPASGVTERADTTSSGGGGATGKTSITLFDSTNPNVSGTTVLGSYFTTTSSTSAQGLQASIVLRDINSAAIGEAITLDGSSALSEIYSGPYTYSDGKSVNTGQAQFNGSTSTAANSLYIAYQVLGTDYIAGFYAENDGIEQEGRVHVWRKQNNWTQWTSIDQRLTFENAYGAMAIDVVRINDSRFALIYGPGDDGAGGSWSVSSSIVVIDINTSTGVPSVVGSSFWMSAGSSRPPQLGHIVTLGPNSVIGWGAVDGSPDTWHMLVCTIATGGAITRGTTLNFSPDSFNQALFASHVNDTKAVAFYHLNGITWSARVVNVSGTTITLGATTYSLPVNATVYSEPVAFSATQGIYMQAGTNSLKLVPYTISGDTITFGTEYTAVTESVTITEPRIIKLTNGTLCIHYRYQSAAEGNPIFINLRYFTYNTGTEIFTSAGSDDDIMFDSLAYPKGKVTEAENRRMLHTVALGSLPYVNVRELPVSTIVDNHNCYISYNESFVIAPVQSAFMHGHVAPEIAPQNVFIDAIERNLTVAQNAFLNGAALPITGFQNIFINGAGFAHQVTAAYLHGPGILSSMSAYIHAGDAVDFQPSYVSGSLIATASQLAYIISILPPQEGVRFCYIGGGDDGSIRSALRFNKTLSQKAQWPHTDAYNGSEYITVNFWMRPTEAPDATRGVYIEKYHTAQGRSWAVFEAATGVQKWHYGVTTNSVWSAQDSTGTYTLNVWYMVTLRYDGSSCGLYVNGLLDSQYSVVGAITYDTGSIQAAFRQDVGYYTSFDFADLTIWNYALTPSEIADLYVHPITASMGAYISSLPGTAIVSEHYAYLSSALEPSNPVVISSSIGCCIAFGSVVSSHNCVIAAGDATETEHDLEITIGDFQDGVWDLLLRIGVQGDRAIRFQDADIEYPITRESYREIAGAFFSDMPGKDYGIQSAFITGGRSIDTAIGDLSNPEDPEVGPNVQWCYITIGTEYLASTQVFISGQFTGLTVVQNCYLAGRDNYVLAYIEGAVETEIDTNMWCWIGAPFSFIESTNTTFIPGLDIISAYQEAMISSQLYLYATAQCFIQAQAITAIDTYDQFAQDCYMEASAVSLGANLAYIEGVVSIEDQQMCFITVLKTVENTTSCYIESPFPIVATARPTLVWGSQSLSGDTDCYIMASLNLEVFKNAYMAGKGVYELTKHAYIVAAVVVNNLTDSNQVYVSGPNTIASSAQCFVGSQVLQVSQTAYIYNLGNVTDNNFAFLNSEGLSVSNSSYITA